MVTEAVENEESAKRAGEACEVSVTTARPEWDRYLAVHEGATLFHDPRWGGLMQQVYANRCYYLTVRRGEKMTGVMQLVAKRSLIFGSHLCSLPYFDASGILADDAAACDALIAKARSLREKLGVGWVELRQRVPLEESLAVRTDKVTVRLRIPDSADVLWGQLKPKVRNQVRKAQREGLTADRGGADLLDEFYRIYVRNMRDLGSPPHSLRFFDRILGSFGALVRLHVVRLGVRPVAASLCLKDRHAMYVPWAGSDWRLRQLCGNMLLYWSMLADACEQGAPVFDFGRGTRGGGTHRFKMQWGGEESPLYWHYLLPEGVSPPEVRHDNPKYRLAEACWRRLPLRVVRLLGPHIVRKLS